MYSRPGDFTYTPPEAQRLLHRGGNGALQDSGARRRAEVSRRASHDADEGADESPDLLVVGGGPAGLTAAFEYLKLRPDGAPLVLEASDHVGGISRTETYKGFRFDIGGHRFFTKVTEVSDLWRELLGDDLIRVQRKSRIFYKGRFYDYPLKIANVLGNLGPVESARIVASYMRWRIRPHPVEETFEQWVVNRFGKRLFDHFFRTYTEKVWGIPCEKIRADWAAQRIKNLSLQKAVINALTKSNDTASLIESFEYPRLGPGMMWERCREKVEDRGGSVRMRTEALRLCRDGARIVAVETRDRDTGRVTTIRPEHIISSMPLATLIRAIDPPAPRHVLEAAESLRYRDFLIVTLILDHEDPFDDNWIYIHSPSVKVGRIQNFRAWSHEMVPHPRRASVGMEYFCHEGDGLWAADDADLLELARRELEELGLAAASSVIDGAVIRQPKAYPVYDEHYKDAIETIRNWLATLENLQTVGRNGMHRYNNQDHSMLTAMLAARNICGQRNDLWEVNVDRSYHEEFVRKGAGQKRAPAAASPARRPVPAPAA